MIKDDELWLKKMKERLDNYSEPLPDTGWERLEKSLPTSPPMSVGTRKNVLFRRWAMAAAAVVLVAVSSIGLWLMQSPVVDDMRRSVDPALADMPDALPEQTRPAAQGEQPEPVIRRVVDQGDTSYRQPLVAQRLETEKAEINAGEESPAGDAGLRIQEELPVAEKGEEMEENTTPDQQMTENVPSTQPKEDRRRVSRPSGKDKLHIPAEKKSSNGKKGWAVGLSVGNTGGVTSLGNEYNYGASTENPIFNDRLSLADVSNGVLNIPKGQELVFNDGMPYLLQNMRTVRDIKHKQPISFGISVRKSLPKNFSVETGVTYTMLASEITYEGSSEKIDQKLHYIGIPVRANWNFVDNKNFTMYVSAGGAVEKCVYGKIAGEKETVEPVQLSVMGAVGAQYNISNRVGIYVEPGVSYFFDDGSMVETIRKENPTNFTLQAGIRLTY